MTIGIVSGMKFSDHAIFREAMTKYPSVTKIYTQSQYGVAALVAEFVEGTAIEHVDFQLDFSDWYNSHQQLSQQPMDLLLAFWDGRPTRVKSFIYRAEQQGVPVDIIRYSEEIDGVEVPDGSA